MDLFENASSSTWITANQRLMLFWRKQYDQAQQAAGKTVWETLDCLSFKQWILRAYNTLPDIKIVLSESQELVLWENIISQSLFEMRPEWALLSAHSLAKSAQAAWRLLKESDTSLHLLSAFESEEVKIFCQWATLFATTCRDKNQIDFSTCVDSVIKALAQRKIALPAKIILAGFEEMSFQMKRVCDVLAEQCTLQYQNIKNIKPANSQRVGFESEEIELQAMAQWAFKMQRQNPNSAIGCIVPNLNTNRHVIERVFSHAAVAQNKTAVDQLGKYNISGGLPFSHFPLVQTAFDILQLGIAVLDVEILSRLLRSPFLGVSETELTARAALDIRIKETQEPYIHWQKMQSLAKAQGDCNHWLALCDAYAHCFQATAAQQSAANSGRHFSQRLQCMGWPGERVINSAEYQQVERWQALLVELAHLDTVLEKPLSDRQALQHLYHLAQTSLFQPKTADASIQILGVLEAVGLPFDDLWISDMTQANWPGHASPNPFIPMTLQRARNMPHASAERELIYSRVLTQHFCQNANSVIFSYALQKEDQLQAPSSLILEVPETVAADFYEAAETTSIKPQLEYIPDSHGPAIQLGEALRGGASLFKYQAACPFKAFAQIRLGAGSMPATTLSMTPQERGICLHSILEQAWRLLGDQQTLCSYSTSALTQFLQPIVKNALNEVAQKRSFTLKPRFLALEQQRLIAQTLAWLESEKQRQPFKVAALETKQTVQFEGLSFAIRLDREDQLEDGTRLIIDYKTGLCSPADWFGERPDDPQLPLYGVTCEYPVQGLLFAQITADKLQFFGISEKDCHISGVQPIDQQKWTDAYLWGDFLTVSKITLGHIAQSFQSGYAAVDPKKSEQTCRYCDLQPFCRINS